MSGFFGLILLATLSFGVLCAICKRVHSFCFLTEHLLRSESGTDAKYALVGFGPLHEMTILRLHLDPRVAGSTCVPVLRMPGRRVLLMYLAQGLRGFRQSGAWTRYLCRASHPFPAFPFASTPHQEAGAMVVTYTAKVGSTWFAPSKPVQGLASTRLHLAQDSWGLYLASSSR